jgi:hypothetical protein
MMIAFGDLSSCRIARDLSSALLIRDELSRWISGLLDTWPHITKRKVRVAFYLSQVYPEPTQPFFRWHKLDKIRQRSEVAEQPTDAVLSGSENEDSDVEASEDEGKSSAGFEFHVRPLGLTLGQSHRLRRQAMRTQRMSQQQYLDFAAVREESFLRPPNHHANFRAWISELWAVHYGTAPCQFIKARKGAEAQLLGYLCWDRVGFVTEIAVELRARARRAKKTANSMIGKRAGRGGQSLFPMLAGNVSLHLVRDVQYAVLSHLDLSDLCACGKVSTAGLAAQAMVLDAVVPEDAPLHPSLVRHAITLLHAAYPMPKKFTRIKDVKNYMSTKPQSRRATREAKTADAEDAEYAAGTTVHTIQSKITDAADTSSGNETEIGSDADADRDDARNIVRSKEDSSNVGRVGREGRGDRDRGRRGSTSVTTSIDDIADADITATKKNNQKRSKLRISAATATTSAPAMTTITSATSSSTIEPTRKRGRPRKSAENEIPTPTTSPTTTTTATKLTSTAPNTEGVAPATISSKSEGTNLFWQRFSKKPKI